MALADSHPAPAARQREVLAVANWQLGRDGRVGCAVLWPVDRLEQR